MPEFKRNRMETIVDSLRAIAVHDIQSAYGEACPDCRPRVDTRSIGYYYHCILLNDREYREKVKNLRDEIRSLSRDPKADECYLGHLKSELQDTGEPPDPPDPLTGVPF